MCWRGFVAHSSFLDHFSATTMPPCSINAAPTTRLLRVSQTHAQRRTQLYEKPRKVSAGRDKTALFAWWEMELAKCLPANDIRLSGAFRGRPVLGARMTSSAVAWVVWQQRTVYKLWQRMTENTAEKRSAESVAAQTPTKGLIPRYFIWQS